MEDRLAEIENRFGAASKQYRLALVTSSCALRDIGRLCSENSRAPYIGGVSEKPKEKEKTKMANWLSFSGNLTTDPKLMEFKDGSKVCNFDLAHNVRWQDKDGNWQDGTPIYVTCEARGYLADRVKDNLLRGNPVIVEGSLSAQEWEDKETGQPRRKNVLKVKDIAFDIRFHNVEASKAGSKGQDSGSDAEQDEPAPKAKAKPARKPKAKAKAKVVEVEEVEQEEVDDAAPGAGEVEEDDLF